MTDEVLEKLKYPIGPFQWVDRLSPEEIKSLTEEIKSFPAELEAGIKDYKPEDFKKTYRPGAWQIGQLIHHRWAALNETLDPHQWERQYYHLPEINTTPWLPSWAFMPGTDNTIWPISKIPPKLRCLSP